MQYFVYIEFTNPRLRQFFTELRRSLQGRDSSSPIHITVRGPYSTPPELELLSRLEESMAGYGIVLGGAGTFKVPNGYCVYIKAQSPVFAEVWWKRDFPTETHGINPHISVYETTSSKDAKRVETFLRSERLEISTFALRLSVPTSKQMTLFDVDLSPERMDKLAPFENWKVRAGFLQRAATLGTLLRGEG